MKRVLVAFSALAFAGSAFACEYMDKEASAALPHHKAVNASVAPTKATPSKQVAIPAAMKQAKATCEGQACAAQPVAATKQTKLACSGPNC